MGSDGEREQRIRGQERGAAARQQDGCGRLMDKTSQMGGAMAAMAGMFPVGTGRITMSMRVVAGYYGLLKGNFFTPCHLFRMIVPSKRQSRKKIGEQQNIEHSPFHELPM